MNNRLARLSLQIDENGKKLFVPFMTAGYPNMETSLKVFEALAEVGADIIEVGIPFSDPMADGGVIQEASAKSLEGGTTLDDIFALVANIRKKYETPIVLMGYFNPVYKRGIKQFLDDCNRSGVDGLIIPDLSPDEAEEFVNDAHAADISTIFLVAPNTSDERIAEIANLSTEFIYCVSLYGVTGVRQSLPPGLADYIDKVANVSKRKTLVGFGVDSATRAAELSQHADGIVIGSAIVKLVKEAESEDEAVANVRNFAKSVKESLG